MCVSSTTSSAPRRRSTPPGCRAFWRHGFSSDDRGMNQYERRPYDAGEAEVEYLDGDFKVRRPGAYVRCAVTRQPIPLEDLKYWNVERQEAYASPEAKLERLGIKL